MVSWPYTKAMCANNTVDHGGALILTTHERAEALGVPADHRVYLRDLVTAADSDTFLTRADVAACPASTTPSLRSGSAGGSRHP